MSRLCFVLLLLLVCNRASAQESQEGWRESILRLEKQIASQQAEIAELRARLERQEEELLSSVDKAEDQSDDDSLLADARQSCIPPKPNCDCGKAACPTCKESVATCMDEGLWFSTERNKIRIGGLLQLDARIFTDSDNGNTQFLVRRARLYATGTVSDLFSYMLMGRWDLNTPGLEWAYIDSLKPTSLRLRIGLFREPFGLEALYSGPAWDFADKSLGTSNFLQLEDLGMMVFGKTSDEVLDYSLGIFNGRGRSLENNFDKEIVGRIVVAPFLKNGCYPKDLFFGVSGSYSKQSENLSSPAVDASLGSSLAAPMGTAFMTGSGTAFWTWAPSTIVRDHKIRWGADLEWLHGPIAFRTEYLHVDWGNIVRGADSERFRGYSWYAEGAYVLTGEDKRRNKTVLPYYEFDGQGGSGAWELVGRYEGINMARQVLTTGLATGTNRIYGFTLGTNWYLNRYLAVKLNWQFLTFSDRLSVGSNFIDHESVITLRVQSEF